MARQEWNKIKRQREYNQLEVFKESFIEIKNSKVEVLDPPNPDGVILTNNKKISIELTELLWDVDKNGINKKEQESLGDQIVCLAEKRYKDLRLPILYVSVSFTDKYGLINHRGAIKLNPDDKNRLSDYIVDKVIANTPVGEEMVLLEEYNELGKRIMDEKISCIWVGRYKALDENCWVTGGGGVIPEITFEKINERVAAKNKRLSNYKKSFDQSWLVLVEYWNNLSGYFTFRFADEVLKGRFDSEFDRIFILRSRRREVIELNKAQ